MKLTPEQQAAREIVEVIFGPFEPPRVVPNADKFDVVLGSRHKLGTIKVLNRVPLDWADAVNLCDDLCARMGYKEDEW